LVCSILQPIVIFSLLCPNILLRTLFSDTLNLCSSHTMVPGAVSGRSVTLTAHLHLIPKPKCVELYSPPICLHDVVLS
jgi:hypothetical protein